MAPSIAYSVTQSMVERVDARAEQASTLVFIGASVRALTEAAVRAGLGAHNQLVAVDFFGDRETRRAADCWIPLAPDVAGILELCAFLRGDGSAAERDDRLANGSFTASGDVCFVMGGGVEPWWPDWVAPLESFGRVLGPAPSGLHALGDLPCLIAPFADAVRCPQRLKGRVPETGHWWVKALNRAGGLQVRPGAPLELIPSDCYVEAHVAGDEFSLSYWVDGEQIEVVCAAESAAEPVPGGRGKMETQIVHADPRQIPKAAAALAGRGASVLTETLPRHLARKLRYTGFLGFDFIRDAAGRCWLLDVNLRPTASMLCLPNFAALLARWVGAVGAETAKNVAATSCGATDAVRPRSIALQDTGRPEDANRSDASLVLATKLPNTNRSLATDTPDTNRPLAKALPRAACNDNSANAYAAFHVRATVFAPRDVDFDPACTNGLTDGPEVWLTDLPVGPQHFAQGAPVCTVRASGPERARVLQAAEALCARVRSVL